MLVIEGPLASAVASGFRPIPDCLSRTLTSFSNCCDTAAYANKYPKTRRKRFILQNTKEEDAEKRHKSEMCKIDVKGKAAICSNEVGKDNDEQNFEIEESRAPVQNAILEISEKFFASRVERRRCNLVVIGIPKQS